MLDSRFRRPYFNLELYFHVFYLDLRALEARVKHSAERLRLATRTTAISRGEVSEGTECDWLRFALISGLLLFCVIREIKEKRPRNKIIKTYFFRK